MKTGCVIFVLLVLVKSQLWSQGLRTPLSLQVESLSQTHHDVGQFYSLGWGDSLYAYIQQLPLVSAEIYVYHVYIVNVVNNQTRWTYSFFYDFEINDDHDYGFKWDSVRKSFWQEVAWPQHKHLIDSAASAFGIDTADSVLHIPGRTGIIGSSHCHISEHTMMKPEIEGFDYLVNYTAELICGDTRRRLFTFENKFPVPDPEEHVNPRDYPLQFEVMGFLVNSTKKQAVVIFQKKMLGFEGTQGEYFIRGFKVDNL